MRSETQILAHSRGAGILERVRVHCPLLVRVPRDGSPGGFPDSHWRTAASADFHLNARKSDALQYSYPEPHCRPSTGSHQHVRGHDSQCYAHQHTRSTDSYPHSWTADRDRGPSVAHAHFPSLIPDAHDHGHGYADSNVEHLPIREPWALVREQLPNHLD